MKKRFFWEIFIHYALIILVALGFLLLMESFAINNLLYKHTEQELGDIAKVLEKDLIYAGQLDETRINELCSVVGTVKRLRITVISTNGLVLGDSENDPYQMENHAARPEVHMALTGKTGTAIRTSSTLNDKMFYLAIPLQAEDTMKGVLRISRSITYIDEARKFFLLRSFAAGVAVLILALFSSIMVARKIDGPVLKLEKAAREYADGHLDHKLYIHKPEELKILGKAMNYMAEQLSDRISIVNKQKNQLEAILANMSEPVILLDQDLLITRVNKAAMELFSLETEQPDHQTLIEAIRDVELYDMARQTVTGKQFLEKAVTIKSDREIHLQVHATPLLNDEELCTGLLLVMNNISRLVKLENIRKDFVANVSHELKTPITAIQGFVEILGSGQLTDPKKEEEYLGIVAKQAGRMNAIINDLLQLSGLENYELKPTVKEIFLLDEKLESAKKNCLLEAAKKNINISIVGAKDIKVLVNGFLLEQAVTNLIDNAVKYSSKDKPVEITYGICSDRSGWFYISVKDNGCGIPAKDLSHIFERFYRVDKARSRALGGTGLGLSIVKHITQAHNGDIQVDSSPGEGSTFTIRMPGLQT